MGQCLELKQDRTLHHAGDLMTIDDMTADAGLVKGVEGDPLDVLMIEGVAEVVVETGGDIR